MSVAIDTIMKVSKQIHNGRDCKDIMLSLTEEVGEVAEEVSAKYTHSYKQPGVDGILGEAIDVLINAVDMIVTDNPDITEEEINAVVFNKLNKWAMKEKENMVV